MGQPLGALQGASAQLPPPPPSGSGSVQLVPREALIRLHTPVSPTGRGSDALNPNPKESKHGKVRPLQQNHQPHHY
jgi:hypothetical protein